MKSITIRLDDSLFEWLTEQARLNHRSKNKQIEAILDGIRLNTPKEPYTSRFILLGTPDICINGIHRFTSEQPAASEQCNCGLYTADEHKQVNK